MANNKITRKQISTAVAKVVCMMVIESLREDTHNPGKYIDEGRFTIQLGAQELDLLKDFVSDVIVKN